MSATAASVTLSARSRAIDYRPSLRDRRRLRGAVGRPGGDAAAIPHRGQSAQRPAAELGHRHHRLRHDLRHHLGWVRPLGRRRRGAGQRGRRAADDRGGHPAGHRRGAGRGAGAGTAQRLPDRLRRGQPLRGDAGNGDGRARSHLRQHQRDALLRRADELYRGRPGPHRSAAERDLDLPGGRAHPGLRPAPDPIRALRLRHRRQHRRRGRDGDRRAPGEAGRLRPGRASAPPSPGSSSPVRRRAGSPRRRSTTSWRRSPPSSSAAPHSAAAGAGWPARSSASFCSVSSRTR